MRFKCCENLLHTLNFQHVGLLACGFTFWGDYYGEVFSIDEYRKERDKLIEKFKKGEIPELCRTCGILTERNWDESVGLSGVEITHRPKCSVCDCIYCIATDADPEVKKFRNNYKPYDIKPVLLNMRNNNVFFPGCRFDINGGEICEYPERELQWYVYLAYKQKSPLSFLSSGVKFSQVVYDALPVVDTSIQISVDAGTEKVYNKIKRTKGKFNKVWKNIEKYTRAAEKNPNSRVIVKYIIIPGINDNLDEARAFIKKCDEINCRYIAVSVELHWKRSHYDYIAKGGVKDTINFFANYKKEGVGFHFAPEAHEWIQKQLSN